MFALVRRIQSFDKGFTIDDSVGYILHCGVIFRQFLDYLIWDNYLGLLKVLVLFDVELYGASVS